MFEDNYNCRKTKRCCIDIVIFILSLVFTFIIGIIIGANTGILDALGLGAFVAFAVLVGILIVIRIIMLACFGCKKERKDKDDCYR